MDYKGYSLTKEENQGHGKSGLTKFKLENIPFWDMFAYITLYFTQGLT